MIKIRPSLSSAFSNRHKPIEDLTDRLLCCKMFNTASYDGQPSGMYWWNFSIPQGQSNVRRWNRSSSSAWSSTTGQKSWEADTSMTKNAERVVLQAFRPSGKLAKRARRLLREPWSHGVHSTVNRISSWVVPSNLAWQPAFTQFMRLISRLLYLLHELKESRWRISKKKKGKNACHVTQSHHTP